MAAPARPITDAERWFRERYASTPERDALFSTLSGEPGAPRLALSNRRAPYRPHDVVHQPFRPDLTHPWLARILAALAAAAVQIHSISGERGKEERATAPSRRHS